jgi:hypothetical protein
MLTTFSGEAKGSMYFMHAPQKPIDRWQLAALSFSIARNIHERLPALPARVHRERILNPPSIMLDLRAFASPQRLSSEQRDRRGVGPVKGLERDGGGGEEEHAGRAGGIEQLGESPADEGVGLLVLLPEDE